MKLRHYQHLIPTVSLVKRASVATSPTTIPPKTKEQHEIVKFILKYADIVWAYLKTLPSNFSICLSWNSCWCSFLDNCMLVLLLLPFLLQKKRSEEES